MLTALTQDLDRLAAPLPPGSAIVGPSAWNGDGARTAVISARDGVDGGVDGVAAPPRAVRSDRSEHWGRSDRSEHWGRRRDGALTGPADGTPAVATPLAASPSTAPIFVDTSGQRRKLARRLSVGVVGVLCGYGCLVAISFAGGPIPPAALLPVPGMPEARDPAPKSAPADPGSPTPSAASTPKPHQAPAVAVSHPGGDKASPGAAPAASGQPTPSSGPASSGLPSTTLAGTPQPSASGPAASSSTSAHGNPTPPGHTKHPRPSTGPTP